MKIPTIVNHFEPCNLMKFVNIYPNLNVKYEMIKKRNPLETRLIIIKIGKLKLNKPLTIVNTL